MGDGNRKDVIHRPVGQSASRPVGQSASRPVGQSASRPVGQSSAFLWEPWLIGRRDSHQSGKRIVRQLAVLLGSAALLLPLAEPLGQRSGAVARYLLAMAATAVATPAQAQTTVTLVSNIGQTSADTPAANRKAQAFTTGANASDYTLTSITLHGFGFADSNGNTATLHIGSRTGTKVADFTAMLLDFTLVLTPTSPTTLTQESTYYLVTSDDFGSADWYTTASDDEDSGAAEGWSIADGSEHFRTSTMAWGTSTESYFIIVKGYANTTNNAPTVATEIPDQTAMEGTAFSFTFPDTTFADEDTDDTLSYTAMLSDDSALPSWLSFDDTNRSFSGTPQASDGGTITVRVTASDGTDTVHDDFEIKVATVCAEPTFGTRRQIWTGTVTVGGIQEGIHTNWGYNQSATSPGILSDTDFDIGTNNYTITGIYVADINVILGPGDLSFDLQSATGLTDTEVAALKLHVCDTTPYDFSDATAVSFVEETGYTWDLSLDWSAESTRTLYLSLPANNAATGLPTITSSDGATVGDTLSANQGAIADADGLPATFPDDYTLQWMREDEDGMNGEDITGETSSTYTLTADDVGRKVRVRVSFIDQLSGMETVTSDAYPASGTVVPIPPTVTISGPSSAVEEGNDLMFTLTLDVAAPTDLTVDLTLAETEDVVAATDEGSRTVTVMEGETQATFTVSTRNDDVDETDSVVTVAADGDTPATYEVGSPSEATATVTDDDERGVVVMPPQLTINEGDTRAYTVVLTSAPTGEVSITPSLSVSNPDVTFTPATLTFTALNWNMAQTVMVTTETDADSDNDTATITHTVAGADYGDNNVTASEVMVTVSEIALPNVTIAASASPVSEGAAAVFILTRTGDNTTNALTVSVTVTQNGEVISGTSPTSVTFDAGATTARLGISTDDDNVDEDAGTVTVMVAMDSANPATYLLGDPASATATVAVEDNDARPVVTLSLSPDTITEAAGMSEIRAMLSNPSAVETRVTVSIPADVLDAVELDADPPVLVIPAGMTSSSNVVTLAAVDNDVEASEDLSVTVSGMAVNTVGVTGPAPVTLTITDDDDTTVPRVESIERQTPDASPTNANSLTWRITFSEIVANVDNSDFAVSGSTATIGNVAPVSGEPLAYDVTASGGDLASFNGMVTLGFAASQNIQDEAGNALTNITPPGADNTYEVDNRLPTVEINVPPTSSAPFTAIISFNEVVSGFTVDDVMAGNATLSAFAERTTTPGMVWTVLVTPTADGVVTLTIAAGGAEDAAGNGNMAALQARSAYSAPVNDEPSSMMPDTDTTAPRVASIVQQDPGTSPANADSLTWRVTFSETVTNVDAADFTVSGSTAMVTSVQAVSGETGVYDVTVSGSGLASFNGMVTLVFVSDQNIQDENGNALTTTTPTGANNNSYMVDNTAPMVTITDVPETSTAPFTATITFNEVVSDFTMDDVTAVNATLSDFTEATTEEATPGTVWTMLVTPEMDGAVTLNIAAGVAMDAAGNGNTAAAQVRSIYAAPDRTAPMVTITDVPETSTAPFTATITFNEVVSGFTMADITVVNATLSAFTEATTEEATPGTVWTVLVTPMADGLVILEIGAGVATDAAGNGNTAATQARSTYSAPVMETEAKEEAKAVLEDVVLPEVIQQLTAETTEVITSRLNTIASGSQLGTPLTLSLDEVVADTVAFFHGERERLKNGSLDWRQALSGRDFVLPLSSLNLAQRESASTQDNPFSTLALWGGGNYSSYRNIIENTDIDGNGFSAVIGMDLQPIPRLTTGLALTTSRWGLDYATNTNANDATNTTTRAEGAYEIGVTMVNPYVNWSATEQLSFWATVGYGRGEVEQIPEEGDGATRTDGLTSWAGGLRFQVIPSADPLTGEGSPFGLAIKVDGATSSFLDTHVQLARLAAEVSRSFAVENGLLSAALELGWRLRSVSDQDDLDGQQQAVAEKNDGGGAELAGSLNWRNTDGSLSATVDARVLLGGGHHREWGIGGHLRLTPSKRDGEGLSLTLQPSFGITGTKLDELWSLPSNSDLAINNDQPTTRLDAELAYGFPLGNNALLTPYTELTWGEDGSTYGAGLRYGLNSSLELDLKGARRNRANGNTESLFLLEVSSHL